MPVTWKQIDFKSLYPASIEKFDNLLIFKQKERMEGQEICKARKLKRIERKPSEKLLTTRKSTLDLLSNLTNHDSSFLDSASRGDNTARTTLNDNLVENSSFCYISPKSSLRINNSILSGMPMCKSYVESEERGLKENFFRSPKFSASGDGTWESQKDIVSYKQENLELKESVARLKQRVSDLKEENDYFMSKFQSLNQAKEQLSRRNQQILDLNQMLMEQKSQTEEQLFATKQKDRQVREDGKEKEILKYLVEKLRFESEEQCRKIQVLKSLNRKYLEEIHNLKAKQKKSRNKRRISHEFISLTELNKQNKDQVKDSDACISPKKVRTSINYDNGIFELTPE